jgi:Xaa-Pro dipeptidase
MWSVPPPSVESAKQTHDATSVEYTKELPNALLRLLKALPGALVHTLTRESPHYPAISGDYIQQVLGTEGGAVTDLYLLLAVQRARLTKDEEEVALMRKANQISSRAHEVVMRVLGKAVKGRLEKEKKAGVERPLLPGEWLIEKEAEAEAIFVASCRREGHVSLFFCCTELPLTSLQLHTPGIFAHRSCLN